MSMEIAPVKPRPFDLLEASTLKPQHLEETSWPPSIEHAIPILTIYLDTSPTPSSAFTSYKTTNREHYNASRARAGITSLSTPEEVVLYNETGEVTEGSIRNVAFWRAGSWVTPRLESGCLAGTVRRWLLEELGDGCFKEGRIMRDEVVHGEWVLTSNGVEGCSIGRMVVHSS